MFKHLEKSIAGVIGISILTTVSTMMLTMKSTTAQPANFRSLTLNSDTTSGMMMGSTGGSTSLPAIVKNRDRSDRPCLGFGDPNPNHVLVLQQPVAKLRIRVDSGGADTTLAIAGPNGVIRCGDDSSSGNKDASIEDTDWSPGTYQIWVGTVQPNTSRDYRLIVRGN